MKCLGRDGDRTAWGGMGVRLHGEGGMRCCLGRGGREAAWGERGFGLYRWHGLHGFVPQEFRI